MGKRFTGLTPARLFQIATSLSLGQAAASSPPFLLAGGSLFDGGKRHDFVLLVDVTGSYNPANYTIWALGWSGTTPIIGDWNGDGKSKAGAFINGYWYLDYNGNGVFDGAGTDRIFAFGAAGDTPVVGRW